MTADTTLYAKWTAIPSTSSYTVTFNSNGGTEVPSLTGLDSGAKIAAPTAPSREAYTFGGWYKDESLITPWNFATDTVTANTVLYAKWVSKKDRFSTATAVYDKDGNATTPWEITDDEDDLLPPVDSAVDLNVWARILSASDKVYKVDIEWGAMTFEYVTGKWDTELHAYSGEGSWSAGSVDGVNNKITLTNHSNGSVDANFAQSMESAVFGGDVTGGFYETETAAKEAAGKTPAESGALDAPKLTLATADGTTVAEAPKGSLYFALSGTPNGGTAGSTPIRAGSLTVTVVPGT